jgi:hypothetical protein
MSFSEVVKAQRRVALANPCQHALQCFNDAYMFTVHPAQGLTCGVNLTVNIGQE